MPEARLAITCGLPKSGKTTYARGLQEAWWVRVCPDEIRQALQDEATTRPPSLWCGRTPSLR